jgi:hypothetical protein
MTSSPAEQANTVLKMTVKVLRHVSLNPCTVGRIVEVCTRPSRTGSTKHTNGENLLKRAEIVVHSQHPVTPALTLGQM